LTPEHPMKSAPHIPNKAKEKLHADRFLIVGILLALAFCVTGILFTNLHFNRENGAFLDKVISDKLQTAREAMDRKKWDEAIELLTVTKASTNPDELDDAGRETLAKLDRLLSEAPFARFSGNTPRTIDKTIKPRKVSSAAGPFPSGRASVRWANGDP